MFSARRPGLGRPSSVIGKRPFPHFPSLQAHNTFYDTSRSELGMHFPFSLQGSAIRFSRVHTNP